MIFTMLQIISGSISPLSHVFDHAQYTWWFFGLTQTFVLWWSSVHYSSTSSSLFDEKMNIFPPSRYKWRFTVFALLCFSFVVCPCVVCITSNSLLHQRVKEERWSLVIIYLLLQKCTDFAWNCSFIIVPLSSFESFWVSHTKSVLILQICVIMQYNFSE